MAITNFIFYQLDFEPNLPIEAFEKIDELEDFSSFKIIFADGKYIDIEVKWLEEKIIHDGIFQGELKTTTYFLERQAFIRILWGEKIMISSGLGTKCKKFVKTLFSNCNLEITFFEKMKFKLLNLLNKYGSIDSLQPELYNVKVESLPVDQIANASIQIKECSFGDLKHLIEGTNAFINKITLNFSNVTFPYVTFSCTGKISINNNDSQDYQGALDFIEELINVFKV
jgi:hypothetical protein